MWVVHQREGLALGSNRARTFFESMPGLISLSATVA